MSSSDLKKMEDTWVQVQKKTFTKWTNTHLVKKGFKPITVVEEEFDDGINLMNLVNALYEVPIPKYNKAPKMRPHKLDNIALAMDMLEKQAMVKTNFLKSVHLADHDLKMILGMIWSIILDFQIKGISVEELTAKEGLLLWCQKKTAGYKDVKIENFSTSWTNGLAFCALIHRHRPDLLNFDELSKDNAEYNLNLAFDVAEKELGIAKLLDVEDLTNVARPDERSVMTYVSEYFHCFAFMDVKENAARRVKKFAQFNQAMEEMEQEYESQVAELLQWINEAIERLEDRSFGDTYDSAKQAFEAHKVYVSSEKPHRAAQKLDCEVLFANIQTKLAVYERNPYQVPPGSSSEDVDAAWNRLEEAERRRGVAVRENMFKFITKATSYVDEDKLREFEQSFQHFDKDGSGELDKIEFKAALQTLSIPFRDEAAFLKVFETVSEGQPKISKEQYVKYLISIYEDKDTPDQIKSSFQILADNSNAIVRQQLQIPPLEAKEIDYLSAKMPGDENGRYDYVAYTDQVFRGPE